MQGPTETAAGDAIFQLHRYSGFAALAFAFLFWMTLVFRRRGTAPSALFPWFTGERRRAFAADLGNHLRTVVRGRLPAYEETGPLASAVHGLGLLLMTTMAVSARARWFGGHDRSLRSRQPRVGLPDRPCRHGDNSSLCEIGISGQDVEVQRLRTYERSWRRQEPIEPAKKMNVGQF
jgi:hypothetical protein